MDYQVLQFVSVIVRESTAEGQVGVVWCTDHLHGRATHPGKQTTHVYAGRTSKQDSQGKQVVCFLSRISCGDACSLQNKCLNSAYHDCNSMDWVVKQ